MAFEEITVDEIKAETDTGLSVSLVKMRNAPAKLKVSMRPKALAAAGFGPDERLQPLLGTGEHHGLLRLRKDKNGAVQLRRRDGPHGSEWSETSLGHRPEFLDRARKAERCSWEKIDVATIEIVLPDWADETRPKASRAVSALPPPVAAAQREAARIAAEQSQTAERRAEREAMETSKAWSEFRDRLAGAPRAEFARALKLTRSEAAFLTVLADRAPRIVSKDALLQLLYADRPDDAPSEKLIDVWVCKIRPKIAGTGCEIETIWGEGFRFTGEPALLHEERAA